MHSVLPLLCGGKVEKRKEVKEGKHSLFSTFPPQRSGKTECMGRHSRFAALCYQGDMMLLAADGLR